MDASTPPSSTPFQGQCHTTPFGGLQVFKAPRFGDHRGFFQEIYQAERYQSQGLNATFCQDNVSLSAEAGTLRGLHFQLPPHAQGKLVSVLAGSVWDVAVDLRADSPTLGQHFGLVLRAEEGTQLYVPPGFAHGFLTLEPHTLVCYKVTAPYAAALDRGIAWNDPAIAIAWPLPQGLSAPVLSAKDAQHPTLAQWLHAEPTAF
jgi:dTDP-4-dehydrorhamnose 3,5-epimerase